MTTDLAPDIAPDLAHALPLTGRRLLGRILVWVPVVVLLGGVLAVALAGRRSGWAAVLSAALPGLGQLVQGRLLVGVIFLVLALGALLYAIMRSGGWTLVLLSPAAIVDAATHGARWAIPAGVLAGAAVGAAVGQVNLARRRARARRFEAARGAAVPASDTARWARPTTAAPAPALDRFSEAYLRYFLRFGHSDPTDWSVFDDPKHADSAIRYQMVLTCWALYLFQHQYTPAYREAVGTALGNLAERGRDHRVWAYTKRTNLKAFRLDGDPFARENVMYSGYIADMISMYEAMTGDRRYDEPGGYSVSDGRRTYEWSHTDIVDTLAVQHATSPSGSITCVPGWVWPACQSFSLRAIHLGDMVHGTDHRWAVERFQQAFPRYFIDGDGHIDFCRHVGGFSHPIDPLIVGISGQAGTGVFVSSFGREMVEGNYERQVRARMSAPDDDGRIILRLGKMDTWDTSYGFNPAMPYSLALLYAAELGDAEATQGLRRTLEEMLTPDGERPGPGSILSMAITFLALITSEGALAAADRHAPFADTGPELVSAPWPEVLVTRAVRINGGLRAELTNGPAVPDAPVTVGVAGLLPGRPYRTTGGGGPTIAEADAEGRLAVDVGAGPQRLEVFPA